MNIHYYKVLGPKSRAVAQEIDKASGDVFKARKELIDDYKADGLFMGGKDADIPSALAFKEEQDSKFLIYKGFNGQFHKYAPKKNTKEGKALAERLGNPELQFSISKYILDSFGVNACISAGKKKKKYYSTAGVVRDMILITVPGDVGMEGFPHIPFFMKEITQEEYKGFFNPETKKTEEKEIENETSGVQE